MHTHDQQTSQAAPESEESVAAPAMVLAGPQAVLALQRTAGNRAVRRMLLNGRPTPPARAAIQRRRVPTGAVLQDILSDPDPGGGSGRVAAADEKAHLTGLTRLFDRAGRELSTSERNDFVTLTITGKTVSELTGMPAAERSKLGVEGIKKLSAAESWESRPIWANALEKVRPNLILGDPALIDTPPRVGTADATNINTLVVKTRKIFDAVATGKHNQDLKQIFGQANVATAKRKFAEARKWMDELHRLKKIVTDRSGYSDEVSMGGLTGFHSQIALAPDAIDDPTADESVVLMVHESMHAGNSDVRDKGYVGTPGFTTAAADRKLTNAAHFEVVARRNLKADHDYDGVTFTPAGGASPSHTPREDALDQASEMFRASWNLGLNLHRKFVAAYKNPGDWNTLDLQTIHSTLPAGTHYSDVLPFWSKVLKLTIHERTHINPTGGRASTAPVTQIDIALSEGSTRLFAQCMDEVPRGDASAGISDDKAAEDFEKANATAAEIAAATTVDKERDLLIKLVLKKVGEITGLVDRDVRVVLLMGQMPTEWADILKSRAPADFVD